MSESKHTPGPWDNNSRRTVVRQTETAEWIADVGGRTTIEAHNNARLIAAAPETARQRDKLLEAATEALFRISVEESEDHTAEELCDKLRAAIAHAKGE